MMSKARRYVLKGGVLAMLLFTAFVMLAPFAWMLSASFKNNIEIFESPINWIPKVFRADNYRKVWVEISFISFFVNSLKLAVGITIAQLGTCSLAAYAFSKMRFPGRDKIFVAYLATMMIPWHAIMIPQFVVVKTLGLYNSHWSLVLIQAFSAFGVFMLRQNMMSIPDSLHEAARIDGCGSFRIYSMIIMPLCKTGLATLTVLTFNGVWNDYMGPMLYLDSDSLKTVQLALASFKRQYSADYGAIMAGTICSIVPIVLVYICAQKYIVEGVAFAGVKG